MKLDSSEARNTTPLAISSGTPTRPIGCSEAKAAMARTMIIDLPTAEGLSPVMTCLERLASSLAKAYAGETDRLVLPKPGLPLGF